MADDEYGKTHVVDLAAEVTAEQRALGKAIGDSLMKEVMEAFVGDDKTLIESVVDATQHKGAERIEAILEQEQMPEPICRNCLWWSTGSVPYPSVGKCHGAPPQRDPNMAFGVFPATLPTDYCGQFKFKAGD